MSNNDTASYKAYRKKMMQLVRPKKKHKTTKKRIGYTIDTLTTGGSKASAAENIIRKLRKRDVVVKCKHDTRVTDLYDDIFKRTRYKPDVSRRYAAGGNSHTFPTPDDATVIKIIDKMRFDFDYDKLYAVIVMERIEDSDKKPTKEDLEQIDTALKKRGVIHGDLSSENVLWDERDQAYKAIDFGLSRCREYAATHSFEDDVQKFKHEIQNEVVCQQVSSMYGLSPAIRAFWFVKLKRDAYVLPPKRFTDDERSVLFAMWSYFFDMKAQEPEKVRFIREDDGSITYVNEQGERETNVSLQHDAFEEEDSVRKGGFQVGLGVLRYKGKEVRFAASP